MQFAIVIEKAEGNYSAYAPDLPGCIAVEDTLEEVEKSMKEAIEFHLGDCNRRVCRFLSQYQLAEC